jgi:hypothetical protein
MSTTEYPYEESNPRWPIVREWHLSPTRRVLIVHDDNPECPAMNEEGADIWWNGKGNEPFWDVNSGRYAYEKPPGHAFPFRYYDTRNGSRFDLLDDDDFTDDDEPTGWLVMDDDWTDPASAAEGFMQTMNYWCEGECYGWVVQTRHHFTSTTTDTELDEWEHDDSCWGYYGDDVLDAVRESVEGVPA